MCSNDNEHVIIAKSLVTIFVIIIGVRSIYISLCSVKHFMYIEIGAVLMKKNILHDLNIKKGYNQNIHVKKRKKGYIHTQYTCMLHT